VEAAVSVASLHDSLLRFAGLALAPEADRSGGRAPELPLWEASAQASAPEAVFVESLNQVGVARADAFLRRDLYSAEDTRFWEAGNPNSGGGFWAPQGEESRRLGAHELGAQWPAKGEGASETAPAADDAAVKALRALLDDYAAQVLAARQERLGEAASVELTPAQREALEALGYAE